MNDFLLGAIVVLALLAGAHFWQFWRSTRDRLFIAFSGCFILLGISFGILAIWNTETEVSPFVYVVRLCAFLLLIVAIIDRNRRPDRRD